MIGRLIAWAVVLTLCYGFYGFATSWKNPWSPASRPAASASSPISALLPGIPNGCAKNPDCK